jgi:hypothetical protein
LTKMVTMINTARNYAATSRAVYDPTITDIDTTPEDERRYVPKEGYGVYIERSETPGASRMVLFANEFAGSVTGNDPDVNERRQYNEGKDIVEEEYFISDTVVFDEMIKDPIPYRNQNPNKAVIIFIPPLADTFISNNSSYTDDRNWVDTLTLVLHFAGAPDLDAANVYKRISINKISGFPELEL